MYSMETYSTTSILSRLWHYIAQFFQGIFDYIYSLSAYTFIFGLLFIAILLMFLVVFFTSRTMSIAVDKAAHAKPSEVAPPPSLPPEDKTPFHGGWLAHYLTIKGYFRVGDLSLIFLRGLDLLRERLDTIHYKYYLPWYLLIGTTESGKTSLMRRSELILPLGEPNFDIEEDNPGLRWWFLNRGIVLDIRGDFFVKKEGILADEKGWQTIISLLSRYRARRPLDGIILTIPATELYGVNKLSLEEISDRAAYLTQKLRTTQNFLGLRLSVYVVITKTDTVPGFKSICHTIPHENRSNMLGWSSPYHPGIAYDKSWISEAFGHINHQLNKIRYEIMAEGPAEDTRDGVFVFPSELMHLQKPISLYLNRLFKVSSYDESLFFRGLYFVGDSGKHVHISSLFKEELEDREAIAHLKIGDLEKKDHHEDTNDVHSLTHIFFFKDILNKKAFRETGLVQPIHQRIISANRRINLAKIGIILFAGLSIYGVTKAYSELRDHREYLLPILGRLDTILYQMPENRIDQTRLTSQLFDENTRQLFDMMHNLDRSRFSSLFFPMSWFSPVNENLDIALRVSYDQIILRSIYMDLLQKTRDMLTYKPEPPLHHVNSMADLLQPTKTIEFEMLSNYVYRFIDLSKNIDIYNQLEQSNDPTLLKDLVLYTLGVGLSQDFLNNYSHFQYLLKTIPYAKIDLMPYQGTARETLKNLYEYYIDNLISSQNTGSIVGKLHYILNEYGQRKTLDVPSVKALRQISQDMDKIIAKLGQPGSNWIDNPFFDGGTAFSELMDEITHFKLFGPEMVQLFGAMTAEKFATFQHQLILLNPILSPQKTGADPRKQYPSSGLFHIQEVLHKLFSQKFMGPSNGKMFVTDIPKTHVVFWNPQLIDEATNYIKAYEDFVRTNLETIPMAIRGTLKEAARESLISNVVGLVAQAQTIVPRPQAVTDLASAEETLRDKIDDVKAIVPKFLKLMEVMTEGGVGNSYVGLRTLLGTLSTRLLEQVDQVLEGYGLYKVKENNFNWWDGVVSPVLEGFHVRDESELYLYFDKERALLGRLALDYADFMISFLTAPVMREFNGRDDLIHKWQGIINAIKAYDKKTPDNTLAKLEETLSNELMNINLKKCFVEIPLAEVKQGSPDYFINRRVELRRGVLARCEVLRRDKSLENYRQLAAFFNGNIANKFPFLAAAMPDSLEAEPTDIKEFFKLYKSMGDNPTEIYDQVYQLGADAEDTFAFLNAMEKIKAFFEPYLKSPLASEVPSFDFEAESRVNQEKEIQANIISTWTLKPSENIELLSHEKTQRGKWSYGNEIVVSLTWPETSRLQPFADPKQDNMEVEQNVATFRYPGRWSLFWMIRRQQALRADYSTINEPVPYILKYEIPNGPEDKTITFMRMTILGPSKGNIPGTPIRIPQFPTQAPDIPESILIKAKDPVLVMGNIPAYQPPAAVGESTEGGTSTEASTDNGSPVA